MATKKITELPVATGLTSNETLPLVQNGANVRAAVGVAQVLESFGDLPLLNNPIGKMIFVPDAVGGAVPAYWDGSQWRILSSADVVKTMGEGIWIVGIAASFGLAQASGYDNGGTYFVSLNGRDWTPLTHPTIRGGVNATSYANGCFLMSGITSFSLPSAIVTTSTDPADPVGVNQWNSDPPLGYNNPVLFSEPGDATSYNNPTGEFTVPITGVGNVTVLNQLPSAVTPADKPPWPHNGQTVEPVVGVTDSGRLVEVAIFSTNITITEAPAGTWNTKYLVYRPVGTSEWLPTVAQGSIGGQPASRLINANAVAAGIQFKGLVWGPIKQTAVQFQPGSN